MPLINETAQYGWERGRAGARIHYPGSEQSQSRAKMRLPEGQWFLRGTNRSSYLNIDIIRLVVLRPIRGTLHLLPSMRRAFLLEFVLLFLGLGLIMGCASSRSTQDDAATRAAAVGTWKYEVDGFAPLHAGVFQIAERDGRLQALVQDRRQGRFRARVHVKDRRMELTIDELRISGRIEDDQFTGFLRLQRWDVSTRTRQRTRRRRKRQFRSASLHARRVRSASAVDEPSVLKCESILREANGCN